MKRRKKRQTLLFTNFCFWRNFEGFLDLDVESISNLLFFIVSEMAGVCVINNCFVPILFELLLSSYYDLLETFYLFFANKCICAKSYKIRTDI